MPLISYNIFASSHESSLYVLRGESGKSVGDKIQDGVIFTIFDLSWLRSRLETCGTAGQETCVTFFDISGWKFDICDIIYVEIPLQR